MQRCRCADFVQLLPQFRRNRELQRIEIILQLSQLTGAKDCGGDPWLRSDPIQRNLSGRTSDLLGNGEQHVQYLPVLLIELLESGICGVLELFQAAVAAAVVSLT